MARLKRMQFRGDDADDDHLVQKCWAGEVLTDDTPVVAFHFKLVDGQTDEASSA